MRGFFSGKTGACIILGIISLIVIIVLQFTNPRPAPMRFYDDRGNLAYCDPACPETIDK